MIITGWNQHYGFKPIIEGDFDYYKITFPTTTKTTTKRDGREKQILGLIENNPYLTAEDLAKQVDLTKEGVRYHIKNLKKKNLLKRVGSSKSGHWEVIK